MIIKNLDKGENYHLFPSTQLEVERTNPFFNEYGEQTVPLSLPASPHNCRLLDHPERPGNRNKATAINALIQDGEYCTECSQFVLTAQENGVVETNFYLNDGSFYSRIQNTRLKDIIAALKETVTFGNIASAVEYMKALRDNTDPRLAVFPILVTDDSGSDNGYNFKVINGWGTESESFPPFDFNSTLATSTFYNAKPRKEIVDGKTIDLAEGYYMSPFIRANYVLYRVMEHFGYDIDLDNILFNEEPFKSMVLLNSCIDTLVNCKLRFEDLVPDVSVSDFINLYRKKFCCEFVPDETTRKMKIVFFRDIMASKVDADLSNCLTQKVTYEYKQAKDYKRLVLKPQEKVDSEMEESYDDIKSLVNAQPTARLGNDGAFYITGYSLATIGHTVQTKVAEASLDFNTGEDDKEEEEVEIPELIPEPRTLVYTESDDYGTLKSTQGIWLYVGDYTTLNSKIVIDNANDNEKTESANKQCLMLAATYVDSAARPKGAIGIYDLTGSMTDIMPTKVFDYALHYYGNNGIYETFWRDYDTLLRNALHKTKATLLLTQSQKQNMPSTATIVINGVPYMFDKLKFTLGGKNEPTESDLLTISPSHPTDLTPSITLMLNQAKGYWSLEYSVTECTKEEWQQNEGDISKMFNVIYPPLPSAEYVGKKYGLLTFHTRKATFGTLVFPNDYNKVSVWLNCCLL